MKKILALFAFCLSLQAQAALISIETDKTTYQVNDVITAKVQVSGLGINELISAYLFKLQLPVGGLQLLSHQFGDLLTGSNGSFQDVLDLGSSIEVAETSYNEDSELATLQQSSAFTLVSFQFKVLQAGQLMLSLLDVDTSGAGYATQPVDVAKAIEVTANPVPAPATLLLLLPVAAWLARRRS